jgi:amino acid transporter/nucleotide-binding universal stress UspA family protein
MSKRKLKRQLNLTQVVMLGTAGTIASEIFVLTGHAAGIAGPATVLALLIGGLLSYSVALNYCELATTYPVAGGAMSYVREAFGNNILSYLVGSMDCISSTFYAALSAVGFAYSLQIFVPATPIVPVAVVAIGIFSLLNILGVTQVGNVQVVLGCILLTAFAIFIVVGLTHPMGFQWNVFVSGETIFVHQGAWANLSRIFATIALVYCAYVGFEVIADDAEEVSRPNRNIPLGILISLTLCTLIYVSAGLVALGTVPWQELAGSETALTDAVRRFIPGWGVPMMAVAGLIATLTSINSAMLSATREAFTLSRDGTWPRPMSKLSRFRTPHISILVIGAISAAVAAIGLVDFLSYISSAGYLFVLFWGSLSMIRLRKLYPNLARPFKVPLYPFTAYVAGATCVLIIAFANWRALLFGAGVLAVFALVYYAGPHVARLLAARFRIRGPAKDRLLIAAAHPRTARSLVHLASIIAQASEDTYICVLSVSPVAAQPAPDPAKRVNGRSRYRQKTLLDQVASEAQARNVALYTKADIAPSVSEGILHEIEHHNNVKLLLAGWPGPLDPQALVENPVKVVLQKARTNVAVLLDRGLKKVRNILVPVGGGPHSRLAIRLSYEIAEAEGAQVTALRVLTEPAEAEETEDKTLLLGETVEEVLGSVPATFALRVAQAESVPEGVLAEAARQPYDLIVIGASEEWSCQTRLFGSVDDWVADRVPCSVLLCRRYEPVAMSWLRRQVKMIEREYERANGHLATQEQGPASGLACPSDRGEPKPTQ